MSFQTFEHKWLGESPGEMEYIAGFYARKEIEGIDTGYRKLITTEKIPFAKPSTLRYIRKRIRQKIEAGRIYPRNWTLVEYERMYKLKSGEVKVKKQERWRDKETGRFIRHQKAKAKKYEEKAKMEHKDVPKVSDTA